MALNNSKCNRLMPLHFKGLTVYESNTDRYFSTVLWVVSIFVFSARCVPWNDSSRYCHDVHPPVCLSGTGVRCDHTVYFSADLSLQIRWYVRVSHFLMSSCWHCNSVMQACSESAEVQTPGWFWGPLYYYNLHSTWTENASYCWSKMHKNAHIINIFWGQFPHNAYELERPFLVQIHNLTQKPLVSLISR